MRENCPNDSKSCGEVAHFPRRHRNGNSPRSSHQSRQGNLSKNVKFHGAIVRRETGSVKLVVLGQLKSAPSAILLSSSRAEHSVRGKRDLTWLHDAGVQIPLKLKQKYNNQDICGKAVFSFYAIFLRCIPLARRTQSPGPNRYVIFLKKLGSRHHVTRLNPSSLVPNDQPYLN